MGLQSGWYCAHRVGLAALTLFVVRAARARGCLTLGVSPGECGAVCVALVDILRVERLCDYLNVCGGAEAAAGLHCGDAESPEGDVKEEDLKVINCALVHVEVQGHLLSRCSWWLQGGGGCWLRFTRFWRAGGRVCSTTTMHDLPKSEKADGEGYVAGLRGHSFGMVSGPPVFAYRLHSEQGGPWRLGG